MNNYYETKKRQGYFFTLHNYNETAPYSCKKPGTRDELILTLPEYWSQLSGRYRNAEEQRAYEASGYVDRELPPLSVDEA